MCEPVGLHRRLSTSTGNMESWVASPPSRPIVQICDEPERFDTKATVRLSGDQTGDVSALAFAEVSCRSRAPSVEAIQRLVVVLLVSASHDRTVNTIHCPSGEGWGAPRRSIRTMSWTPNACGRDRFGGAVAAGGKVSCAAAGSSNASQAATAAPTANLLILNVRIVMVCPVFLLAR